MHRRLLVLISAAALLTATATAAVASPWEREDISEQGGAGVVAVEGAKIFRTANGVSASVSMPTPEPGSYVYPQGATASGVPGHPEAFTLWVFIFFNPEECDGDCDGADLRSTNENVIAGGFNAGGHLAGGPNLTITGHVNHQSRVFGGDNAESLAVALNLGFDLADAEIHLAVAPHGALDPDLLPEQTSTPVGDPNFWWLAIFK